MKGTLTGIGVGPGDPELVTLKAINVIKKTPVLFYPVTKMGAQSAALHIIEPWLSDETRVIPLLSRMTSDPEERKAQRLLQSRQIAEVLENGKDAAMITLGDALLYSTYSYVMKTLQEMGYQVNTIPGISAPSAAAASLNLPLTEEDEGLLIWPGTESEEALIRQLDGMTDNMALLKVSACREALYQWLQPRQDRISFSLASRLGSKEESFSQDIEILKDPSLPYMSVALLKVKRSKE
ncbi:precorrin-2 C20-methyltransferase /cobalt-factor II C20-methyltransferase [Tindallia magadiensis]|uniref:Precorrin-2 C20-methyltransferase /cobalt-factor II C20-methyltransferase n=1 Tax=Tindallia magadiensis TaxID=69895 RepID=A0A1I3HW48_9FIRM|nr:precorrin-2 C(20)-methyltransferase [Tindallia magadiensis]SFI39892.1 precorrin-2 C20-methyltransferase /cobalt-factor II C20-methyltransferase [Tindallia magadiensis]